MLHKYWPRNSVLPLKNMACIIKQYDVHYVTVGIEHICLQAKLLISCSVHEQFVKIVFKMNFQRSMEKERTIIQLYSELPAFIHRTAVKKKLTSNNDSLKSEPKPEFEQNSFVCLSKSCPNRFFLSPSWLQWWEDLEMFVFADVYTPLRYGKSAQVGFKFLPQWLVKPVNCNYHWRNYLTC